MAKGGQCVCAVANANAAVHFFSLHYAFLAPHSPCCVRVCVFLSPLLISTLIILLSCLIHYGKKEG